MSIVYLNGDYMPMNEAKISPMDRGFLFGDGIYEVIPSYDGKLVGFGPHLDRMQDGLDAIEIRLKVDREEWWQISQELIKRNGGGNLGIYFHVSRGADSQRHHAYPENLEPTVYAFAFEIPPAPIPDKAAAARYKVSTTEDLRWKRCNIKSTALLGNVMHYQHGHSRGNNETILYTPDGVLTEAAACNFYVVKNVVVITPDLDYQKLPGITRLMLLDMLKKHSARSVEERVIHRQEVFDADEVWLTSSSKEVAPVVSIEGCPVGTGEVGDVWLEAETLFSQHRYEY